MCFFRSCDPSAVSLARPRLAPQPSPPSGMPSHGHTQPRQPSRSGCTSRPAKHSRLRSQVLSMSSPSAKSLPSARDSTQVSAVAARCWQLMRSCCLACSGQGHRRRGALPSTSRSRSTLSRTTPSSCAPCLPLASSAAHAGIFLHPVFKNIATLLVCLSLSTSNLFACHYLLAAYLTRGLVAFWAVISRHACVRF